MGVTKKRAGDKNRSTCRGVYVEKEKACLELQRGQVFLIEKKNTNTVKWDVMGSYRNTKTP